MEKIRIGDSVRYDGHKHSIEPRYYPAAGTIGVVSEFGLRNDVRVQWPVETTGGDGNWYCNAEHLTVVPRRNTIVITVDKDNPMCVVAMDKSTGKSATAKCSPYDKFDFHIGAAIAFDRLIGKGENAKEEYKHKFKVGDIIIGNELAERYGITRKGWVGVVTVIHDPYEGGGCDSGCVVDFRARSVTETFDKTGYDLNPDCFDLAINSAEIE